MSLNRKQLDVTRRELAANFELSGLTKDQIAADLGLSTREVDDALAPRGMGEPVQVWLMRDYLEQAVEDAGRTPVPFTVLSESNRHRARMWHSLQDAPRHDFAA